MIELLTTVWSCSTFLWMVGTKWSNTMDVMAVYGFGNFEDAFMMTIRKEITAYCKQKCNRLIFKDAVRVLSFTCEKRIVRLLWRESGVCQWRLLCVVMRHWMLIQIETVNHPGPPLHSEKDVYSYWEDLNAPFQYVSVNRERKIKISK